MSPFNLELQLTGLCAFVPNAKDLSQATKLMAVLPNADFLHGTGFPPQPPTGLDGKALQRHRGLIRVPLSNLGAPVVADEALAIYHISAVTRITVVTDPAIALTITTGNNDVSFERVADLTKLIPTPNGIDPLAVSATPPANILAQVLIDGGVVKTKNLPVTIWDFRPSPPAQPFTDRIGHEVAVTYASVNKAYLVIQQGLGGPQQLQLVPDSSGQAVVRISNACDDNPLEWDHPPKPQDDSDFRWFYEVLPDASKSSVKQQLAHTDMPVPRPVSAGGGTDCSPGRFAAITF